MKKCWLAIFRPQKFWLCLLAIFWATALLAGCGSSHHDGASGSSGGGQSLYTKVVFHFLGYDNQIVQGRVMPQGTSEVRFTGYDASGKILYGPQKFTAAQNITLVDVHISVCDFLVEYLSNNGQVLALVHKEASLQSSSTKEIDLSEYGELSDTLSSLTVKPAVAAATKGYGLQFSAIALLKDGFSAPVTLDCTWSSSDDSLAAFQDSYPQGYASASDSGVCEITAQYAGFSSKSQFTISDAVAFILEVLPNSAVMSLGQEQQLSLNCIFSNGTRSDISEQATWQSSNSSVVTVTPAGLLKSESEGTATITATDKVSGQSAQCAVTVNAAKLEKVTLQVLKGSTFEEATTLDTYVGANFLLKALGQFGDGSVRDVTGFATWKVDNDAISALGASGAFRVNSNPGQAVTVKIGSIASSLPQISNLTYVSNNLQVNISDAVLQRIVVTCQGTWSAPSGGFTRQLKATGYYSAGDPLDITNSVNWLTEEGSSIDISSTGLLTTGSPATVPCEENLYAEATDPIVGTISSGEYPFKTTEARIKQVKIFYLVDKDEENTPLQIAEGLSKQFVAKGVLNDDSQEDITKLVVWNSSQPTIFDEVKTSGTCGLFKALETSQDSVQVSANYLYSSEDILSSDNITVTVTDPEIEELALEAEKVVLKVGDTRQFTAKAYYSNGQIDNVTETAQWSCEPSVKANVEKGLVTALAETANGYPATITASLDGIEVQAELVITGSSTLKFTVENAYYQGVSGNITAQVICKDSNNQEYECPQTIVLPASEVKKTEGEPDKIDFDIYASMAATDKIKSVTLYNTLSDTHVKCAFEWWDYFEGRLYNDETGFDVDENEVASAQFDESATNLVANPRQLNGVRNHLTCNYQQSKDIDFANSCGLSASFDEEGKIIFTPSNDQARYYNDKAGWVPIGDDSDYFKGKFDGQKYKISQLFINASSQAGVSQTYVGLFGAISNYAALSNIVIADTCYVSGLSTSANYSTLYVAGICGHCWEGSSITNCINSAAVVAVNEADSSSVYAAGIAGYFWDSNEDCSFNSIMNTGSVTVINSGSSSHAYVGGIVAQNDSNKLRDCCNGGALTVKASGTNSTACVGGITGFEFDYATTNNAYNFGQVTGEAPTCGIGGIRGSGTSSTIANTFYLQGKGASRGRSNPDDEKGTVWLINNNQMSNLEDVPFDADTSNDKKLWVALNNNRSEADILWQINTNNKSVIPLNYPILTVFASTNR